MDILFVDAFTQSCSVYIQLGINLLSTIIKTKSNYTSEIISLQHLCLQKNYPTIYSLKIIMKPL